MSMAEIIRSLQNPRIRQAMRLRDRRGRQQQSRIIVDGWRETCRALEAGLVPLELFVCEGLVAPPRLVELHTLLRAAGAEQTLVTRDVFQKLTFGDRGDGIILVAAPPQRQLGQLDLPEDALIGVLETVEKPGNLGAVIRTADAAGVSAVIVANGGTDLYNPNAIRASLGAVFHLPVCAAPATQVLSWLRDRGATIYAAHVDGAIPYSAVDYRGACAVVLGSESHGLTDAWCAPDITAIALPMLGVVDSLNVSATAAVLFYAALRQRRP